MLHREKCPKAADNFFIIVNKKCPKVADSFSNINENNNCFHNCKQKTVCKTFSVIATMSPCFCHGDYNFPNLISDQLCLKQRQFLSSKQMTARLKYCKQNLYLDEDDCKK